MYAVEVRGLVKSFSDVRAVDGVSFNVRPGEIFGLIGMNGAGKTTTLRMIATLLQKTEGSISVHGHQIPEEADTVRRLISYLPEDAGAYRNLTGRQYLRFMAGFFASREKIRDMAEYGIGLARLGNRIDDKLETYSKGMSRRLLVARALMMKPKLAILDEPTSGLDVINARQVRQVVREHVRGGMSVLMSSHNMLEVELVCDRIALMNEGCIVDTGRPDWLKKKYNAANIEEVFVKVVA